MDTISAATIERDPQPMSREQAETMQGILAGDPDDDWTYRIEDAPDLPGRYYVAAYDENMFLAGHF